MATTLFTTTREVKSKGSYWGSREPYYTFKFEVILNSQSETNMTSSITMNAYLASNDSATSNRWSSSSYYAGFTQTYNGSTTRLSNNNHSSWAGSGGSDVFKKFETLTKTYAHNADGVLNLSLVFNGSSSSSLKYLPENVSISTGALSIPAFDIGKVYGKMNGTYSRGQSYVKANGTWHKGKKAYAKKNGEWKIGK